MGCLCRVVSTEEDLTTGEVSSKQADTPPLELKEPRRNPQTTLMNLQEMTPKP